MTLEFDIGSCFGAPGVVLAPKYFRQLYGPFAGLAWPCKWAGEAVLAPESHVTLRFDVGSCFGTPDVILATFFVYCMVHLLAPPDHTSGPEKFF